MQFANKVAVITGGGSGIGKATALAFAQAGTSVSILDINARHANETVQEINKLGGQALAIAGSIAKSSDVEIVIAKTMEKFGRIDYLFNNAGVEFVAPLLETKESDWDFVFDTNLKGTYLMSLACLKQMIVNGGGVIINNASDAGLRGIKLSAAYSSSKAAIIQLTRSIALDYAKDNIRVNCICPGCIATPLCERFNEEVGARKGISAKEALNEFVQANIPMQRVGSPEEVANVVLFLCSEAAAYVTGAVIPIDGGLTAGV
jgi:NAD(P)-dependent dehydrogenase (short-subunit alcohol dehydrogenase family)